MNEYVVLVKDTTPSEFFDMLKNTFDNLAIHIRNSGFDGQYIIYIKTHLLRLQLMALRYVVLAVIVRSSDEV